MPPRGSKAAPPRRTATAVGVVPQASRAKTPAPGKSGENVTKTKNVTSSAVPASPSTASAGLSLGSNPESPATTSTVPSISIVQPLSSPPPRLSNAEPVGPPLQAVPRKSASIAKPVTPRRPSNVQGSYAENYARRSSGALESDTTLHPALRPAIAIGTEGESPLTQAPAKALAPPAKANPEAPIALAAAPNASPHHAGARAVSPGLAPLDEELAALLDGLLDGFRSGSGSHLSENDPHTMNVMEDALKVGAAKAEVVRGLGGSTDHAAAAAARAAYLAILKVDDSGSSSQNWTEAALLAAVRAANAAGASPERAVEFAKQATMDGTRPYEGGSTPPPPRARPRARTAEAPEAARQAARVGCESSGAKRVLAPVYGVQSVANASGANPPVSSDGDDAAFAEFNAAINNARVNFLGQEPQVAHSPSPSSSSFAGWSRGALSPPPLDSGDVAKIVAMSVVDAALRAGCSNSQVVRKAIDAAKAAGGTPMESAMAGALAAARASLARGAGTAEALKMAMKLARSSGLSAPDVADIIIDVGVTLEMQATVSASKVAVAALIALRAAFPTEKSPFSFGEIGESAGYAAVSAGSSTAFGFEVARHAAAAAASGEAVSVTAEAVAGAVRLGGGSPSEVARAVARMRADLALTPRGGAPTPATAVAAAAASGARSAGGSRDVVAMAAAEAAARAALRDGLKPALVAKAGADAALLHAGRGGGPSDLVFVRAASAVAAQLAVDVGGDVNAVGKAALDTAKAAAGAGGLGPEEIRAVADDATRLALEHSFASLNIMPTGLIFVGAKQSPRLQSGNSGFSSGDSRSPAVSSISSPARSPQPRPTSFARPAAWESPRGRSQQPRDNSPSVALGSHRAEGRLGAMAQMKRQTLRAYLEKTCGTVAEAFNLMVKWSLEDTSEADAKSKGSYLEESISEVGLRSSLERLSFGVGATEIWWQEMFDILDVDGDGRVSLQDMYDALVIHGGEVGKAGRGLGAATQGHSERVSLLEVFFCQAATNRLAY